MKIAPPKVALFSFLISAIALILRGDVCFLLFLPSLIPLLLFAIFMEKAVAIAFRCLPDGTQSPLGALRSIWLAPLLFLSVVLMSFGIVLFMPTWFGVIDAWPRWTGVAPEELIPCLVGFCVQVFVTAALFAWACIRKYLREALPLKEPLRDPVALPLLGILALCLFGLTFGVARISSGKFAHLRAYLTLKADQPRKSLGILAQSLNQAPDGPLADTALYRMARLQEEELFEPKLAIPLLELLLEKFPQSPWADDATYKLGYVYVQLKRPQEALPFLQAFAEQFSESPLRGKALLALAEALENSDPKSLQAIQQALQALEQAGERFGVLRIPENYPRELCTIAEEARRRKIALASRRRHLGA